MTGIDAEINASKDAEKLVSEMLDLPDKLSKRRGSSYSPRFFSLFSVDNILLRLNFGYLSPSKNIEKNNEKIIEKKIPTTKRDSKNLATQDVKVY